MKSMAEYEMSEMERMEHALIQRLQQTQLEQQNAYDRLENVLSTGKGKTVQ